MTWELQHGDCRALMAAMDEASIDSIVTDPPYELTSARPGGRSPATEGKVMKGFMGMEWDGSGVAFDPATWAAALRVLKPGGMLVAFGGSRTYHRMACAIEDAGFEIRDQIMWIYGSGFPKGGVQDGIGTCLKPAHEPIVLARKPLVGSARANIVAHGTGGLNIDACRIEGENTTTKLRVAGDRARDQYRMGTTTGGNVETSYGRWPANVIHDGSDEVLANFPVTKAGGDVHHRAAPKTATTYGSFYDRGERLSGHGDSGSAARFFYCAKASKADRDEGLIRYLPRTRNRRKLYQQNRSQRWVMRARNRHPTIKPEAVMRWLVRLATPPGGIVLDPFTGSGSTGKAAILEGRSFFGCELTAEYVPIARARIAAAVSRADEEAANAAAAAAPPPQMHLFDEERAA